MFSGVYLYVALAVVVAFAGVGGYAAFEHQRVLAAQAQVTVERGRADGLAQSLEQSEADKAHLQAENAALNETIVAQNSRLRSLINDRDKAHQELEAIKSKLGKEDQSCLDRPLPPTVLIFLRDDGPDHGNEDGEAASPASPSRTVH